VIANDDYVLEILTETGLITAEQAEQARQNNGGNKGAIDNLVESEVLSEQAIAQALANYASMEFHQLSEFDVQNEALQLLSADDAKRFQVLPIKLEQGYLTIATYDPLDFESIDSLRHLLSDVELDLICATRTEIKNALVQYYGGVEDIAGMTGVEGEEGVEMDGMTLSPDQMEAGDEEGDAPIIKLVSSLLMDAYGKRASDIHLEPLEKRFRVRFRIDGKLVKWRIRPSACNPP
jgi:general secretion pathway protein E/type IV pilus assembly protein PilB